MYGCLSELCLPTAQRCLRLDLAHALALDKVGRHGRLAGIALGVADVAHQATHRDLAHLVLGNMHRGERRVGEGAQRQVVKADDPRAREYRAR